jgi:hypothetical protein
VSGSLFRTPAERQRAREERTLRYGKVEVGRPRTDRPGEYHAKVEPPPDFLTDEQLEVFDEYRPDRYTPSGDQDDEAARHFSASGFAFVCGLETGEEPSTEDVLAEMALRRGGS